MITALPRRPRVQIEGTSQSAAVANGCSDRHFGIACHSPERCRTAIDGQAAAARHCECSHWLSRDTLICTDDAQKATACVTMLLKAMTTASVDRRHEVISCCIRRLICRISSFV